MPPLPPDFAVRVERLIRDNRHEEATTLLTGTLRLSPEQANMLVKDISDRLDAGSPGFRVVVQPHEPVETRAVGRLEDLPPEIREQALRALARDGSDVVVKETVRTIRPDGTIHEVERTTSVGGPLAGVDPEIEAALRRGDKITAIKIHRQQTGLGLAESKAAIDAMSAALRVTRKTGCATSAAAMLALGGIVAMLV